MILFRHILLLLIAAAFTTSLPAQMLSSPDGNITLTVKTGNDICYDVRVGEDYKLEKRQVRRGDEVRR